MAYETIIYDVADNVATITLNRPDAMNAFNQKMCDELHDCWQTIRFDDDVHVVVMRASGDRAFTTGADQKDPIDRPTNLWNLDDPGFLISPKRQRVWKPFIVALHGISAGGVFYWINEADIVICSDDTVIFDPHVSYGITPGLNITGLLRRIPLAEAMRIVLVGLDERMTAKRAYEIGLVTEVVPRAELWDKAQQLAAGIAAKPPAAVQGAVRAAWESLDLGLMTALRQAQSYPQRGNPVAKTELQSNGFKSGERPKYRLR